MSLVLGLGLEHSCPWPRECLSSERLSLALASDFFCVLGLGLEPCVLDSTSGVSNLIKHNGEFTKSPLETLNYLLDILSPGSQQIENHATRSDLVNNPSMTPKDTDMIANIRSFERMGAAINDFQPFKAPGPDGLYPVLLQKGWNQQKECYHVIFQACLRHSYVPLAWKEGTGIFLPKPGKESYFEAKSFCMITLTSFQLKWLERLVLYHSNKDNNVQAKLSASQDGFRKGVSTETALHEFVRHVKHCVVRKKPALGIFLDILGAFDNVPSVALLQLCKSWARLRFSPHG